MRNIRLHNLQQNGLKHVKLLGCYSFTYGWKNVYRLYLKATDSHQYLHCFSCHLYHCKKGISHCQALSLNRICSDPISLDKRCNHLEKWLIERGYSEREVGKQILRARGFQETPCWIEKIPEKNKTK